MSLCVGSLDKRKVKEKCYFRSKNINWCNLESNEKILEEEVMQVGGEVTEVR